MVEPTRIMVKNIGPVAWLVAANGRHAGRDTRLNRVTVIGRDGLQSDIVIDDSSVSATHAKIRVERGRFVLYDLASTNNTVINGRRVQKQTLADGDTVVLGRAVFIFKEVQVRR